METYELFPKSLGQILQKFSIDELHLSFTQGRYMPEWGYPILPAPGGVELWARFRKESQKTAGREDRLWRGLVSALSGLFCSTLEQMDVTVTTSPQYSFEPDGHSFLRNTSSGEKVGLLRNELICWNGHRFDSIQHFTSRSNLYRKLNTLDEIATMSRSCWDIRVIKTKDSV